VKNLSPLLILILSLILIPATASANPVDMFGFGARGPAMANAQTAATNDGGANYYNQGALAVPDDIQIDLGYRLAEPSLRLNGNDQNVDPSSGLNAALLVPGHVAGVKVAFGVGVFLPDDRITRVRTLPASRPRWIQYDNRPQRIFIAANLAFQLGDSLYIGGGLAFMSKSQGAIDLTGRLGYPDANDSDFVLDIDVSLASIRYFQGGILWKPNGWLDVGLSYRGSFVLELDQGFALHGDVGAVGSPVIQDAFFELHSLSMDLFQPEQVTAGFAARLTPRLLVAGDLQYEHWGDMQNPASVIQLTYDLKQFNNLVHIPPQKDLENTYFHDTFNARLGVEFTAAVRPHATWKLRAGYAYEPTPAPEQRGETNFVDNDKHTFSAGLGISVHDVSKILVRPFDLDFYFAGTWLPDREHSKLSPIDPVGDYVSSGYVLAGGMSTKWRF
jgi:long-chain fatty acid transport protein